MLELDLCNYSGAYVHVTIIITGAGVNLAVRLSDEINKQVVFKNCAPYTTCISEINNTQTDQARDTHVVIPMYNLTEFSNNYSKTSGREPHYRDSPNGDPTDLESLKLKAKITGSTLLLTIKM